MKLFWIQLQKELYEQWATRKMLVVLAVMLVFGFLAPITAKLLPELVASIGQGQNVTIILPPPTAKDSLDQFIKNTSQLVLLIALLLSFTVVVSERERGLMQLIFPHALPRTTFILAKFTALSLLLGLGMLLQAVATYLYTTLLFSAPDLMNFINIVVLLYIYLIVFVALAVLASTLGRTTTIAASITVVFAVLVVVLSIFTKLSPNKLSEWAAVLNSGRSISIEPHWDALLVSIVVIVLSLAASCVILNRQEIVSASGT